MAPQLDRQCEHCGYSLRGLIPSIDLCPECGRGNDLSVPFRMSSPQDLGLVCLNMLWPTTVVCIVPVLALLSAGWVAIMAIWPPLLWGWLLAAIGQPLVASRRYVRNHVLVPHRLLARRCLLAGAVGANSIQTLLILRFVSLFA